MSVTVRESERESNKVCVCLCVCVCVCVYLYVCTCVWRERERGKRVWVWVWVFVCEWLCDCVWERECVCVCVRERGCIYLMCVSVKGERDEGPFVSDDVFTLYSNCRVMLIFEFRQYMLHGKSYWKLWVRCRQRGVLQVILGHSVDWFFVVFFCLFTFEIFFRLSQHYWSLVVVSSWFRKESYHNYYRGKPVFCIALLFSKFFLFKPFLYWHYFVRNTFDLSFEKKCSSIIFRNKRYLKVQQCRNTAISCAKYCYCDESLKAGCHMPFLHPFNAVHCISSMWQLSFCRERF